MNIRVCIIDDSPADLEMIRNAVIAIIDPSVIDAYSEMAGLTGDAYDIYILDIELGESNGFSIAKKLTDTYPGCTIIFCSSHEDLVFDSLNYFAFHFVRKSHLQDDMQNALHKYLRYSCSDSYIVQNGDTVQQIRFSDITYIDVIKNDLYFHICDGNEYYERKSLKSILDVLPEKQFLRTSMNIAVNVQYVSRIDRNTLYLTDGTKISISRSRIKPVVRQYKEYLLWR